MRHGPAVNTGKDAHGQERHPAAPGSRRVGERLLAAAVSAAAAHALALRAGARPLPHTDQAAGLRRLMMESGT
jgi:hypothetical protein